MENPIAVVRAAEMNIAERDALSHLVGTTTGSLRDALAHVLRLLDDHQDVVLHAQAPPRAETEWDGYETQLDLLAATIYNVRAHSPREMTPERWTRIKKLFPGSARLCLEQAEEELADM